MAENNASSFIGLWIKRGIDGFRVNIVFVKPILDLANDTLIPIDPNTSELGFQALLYFDNKPQYSHVKEYLEKLLTVIANFVHSLLNGCDKKYLGRLIDLPRNSQLIFVTSQGGKLRVRLPRSPGDDMEEKQLQMHFLRLPPFETTVVDLEYLLGSTIFLALDPDSIDAHELIVTLRQEEGGSPEICTYFEVVSTEIARAVQLIVDAQRS